MSYSLRERRLELGLTLEEVAQSVGVGKSTVRKWETGSIQNMGRDKILSLSKVLKLSPLDIIDPEGDIPTALVNEIRDLAAKLTHPRQQRVYDFATDQLSQQRAESDQVNEKVVPLHPTDEAEEREIVTGRATAAGAPINGDDQDAGAVSTLIKVDDIPRGADEIVTVDGDSMEPDFHRGQQIYLHYQESVENGELAIVRVEDEGVTFKQIYIDDSDCSITLHSLNSEYEDRVFAPRQVSIIGRVID